MPSNKQRRAAELRHLRRQQARREQQTARQRRVTMIASIVGVAVVLGVVVFFLVQTGGSHSPSADTTPSGPATALTVNPSQPLPTNSAKRVATYPCTWQKSGTATRPVKEPTTTTPPRSGTVNIAMKTTRGTIKLQLDRKTAPCTVASFLSLVQQKYYDNTPCPRVTTAGIYILQCGDPKGDGSGSPGYTIPDEATGNENYAAGTLAMARGNGSHSGGSQFFLVYQDSPNLQQHQGQLQYTIFGHVTSGLDVLTKVAAKGSDNSNPNGGGNPKLPISISSISVVK